MNISQLIVVLFGLAALATCLWAIVVIVRSPHLRLKPLWIIGSLFGFMGLGIEWTKPDDLVLLVGIMIPVVSAFKVTATGQVIVKTGFPVVAAIALAEARGKARRAA